MSSDFKELQNKWDSSKKSIEFSTSNFDKLHAKIKSKEKENYFFYYGTITILLITLIVISLFFYYVAPVKETLSRLGVGLMIFGLVFRIFIEIISIYKAKQINNLDNTLKTAENSINFHQFRKTIHKVIAPIIIVLYTIGFYLITPEFSSHMEFWNILLIDISYVVIGIILFIVIRKGVKKEMEKLTEIVKLKNEITEEK
jgi:Ca2+/Na+ antiporter